MFGALLTTGGTGGRQHLQMLDGGYQLAPWEISQLDRHMLSYCVSLENTPSQVCFVYAEGMFHVFEEQKRKTRARTCAHFRAPVLLLLLRESRLSVREYPSEQPLEKHARAHTHMLALALLARGI